MRSGSSSARRLYCCTPSDRTSVRASRAGDSRRSSWSSARRSLGSSAGSRGPRSRCSRSSRGVRTPAGPTGIPSPPSSRPSRTCPPPAGRVAVAAEVGDRGTGVVALIPAHGATDAIVAARIGIDGWPVLDARGGLTLNLRHKYAGLSSEAAESFILRDLSDGGHLFAQVTVPRGLPRCAVCGAVLLWQAGAVWAAVPANLPATQLEGARRAWPGLSVPPVDDPVPWPSSELGTTSEPSAPQLRECGRCGRLTPP